MDELPRRELPLPPGPRPGISMTEASWLYELFFMFLQISPSYRIASLEARGRPGWFGVDRPSDFGLVKDVYADLGNVYYLGFEQWWNERARLAFGHDNALPLEVLGSLPRQYPALQDTTLSIVSAVGRYIHRQRDEADRPAVAILGVPLYSDKEACVAAFRELLDELQGTPEGRVRGTPYRFVRTRRKHGDLIRLLQLVWLRAGFRRTRPRATAGHRIMSRVGLTALNRTTPAKARSQASKDQSVQKTNAAIAMHARLREAYRIAENAARGVFPSEQPLADESTWKLFLNENVHRLIRYHLRFDLWQEREYMRKKYPGRKRGIMVSIDLDGDG